MSTKDNLQDLIKSETKNIIQPLVREEVRLGVTDVMKMFGIDTDNVRLSQADFAYLRASREKNGSYWSTVRSTITNAGVMAGLIVAWEGFKGGLR